MKLWKDLNHMLCLITSRVCCISKWKSPFLRCTITYPYNNSQSFLFSTGTIIIIYQTSCEKSFPCSKIKFRKFYNFWCMTNISCMLHYWIKCRKVSQTCSNTSFFFSVNLFCISKSDVFSLSMERNTSFDVLDGVTEGLYKVRHW